MTDILLQQKGSGYLSYYIRSITNEHQKSCIYLVGSVGRAPKHLVHNKVFINDIITSIIY